MSHFTKYNQLAILIGPGNNGADGYSLGLKLEKLGKQVNYYYSGDIGKVSQANRYYRDQCEENHLIYVDEDSLLMILIKVLLGLLTSLQDLTVIQEKLMKQH